MCGIVGYVGSKPAAPLLMSGLARLEYRGYDSAGIATIENTRLILSKRQGKVVNLEPLLKQHKAGNAGIGHTRWATHGEPSDVNAHPHLAPSGGFALVHNGIIENYRQLKSQLAGKGYAFKSQTDTEVLACLIDDVLQQNKRAGLFEAVQRALLEVVGAYAIVVIEAAHPDRLITAKKGSPLVIGIADDGSFMVASDAAPIVGHSRKVVYLQDGRAALLTRGEELKVRNIKMAQSEHARVERLDYDLGSIEKSGYEHFMLKEIHEQPRTLQDCLRGRVHPVQSEVKLGGIADVEPQLLRAKRIMMVGCGTASYAARIGEYLIEAFTRVPVEVDLASEFRYRQPIIEPGDVLVAVSQSGETADTLAAVELAKTQGALTLGICNVVGSSIARLTDAGIYTHAGSEVSVASTKAFTAQVIVLTELALRLGVLHGRLNESTLRTTLEELSCIPQLVEEALQTEEQVKSMAADIARASSVIFIGRGVSAPVASEGAIKLKEISYIHAEGYPGGELKHGPLALIDESTPTVAIVPDDEHKHKMISNIEEVAARKGPVWVVTSDKEYAETLGGHAVVVPRTHELLSPLITVVPLQLLAYHVAVMKGHDVDKPRNLAKSVTVE